MVILSAMDSDIEILESNVSSEIEYGEENKHIEDEYKEKNIDQLQMKDDARKTPQKLISEEFDISESPVKSSHEELNSFDNSTILPLLINCKRDCDHLIINKLPANIFKNAWYILDISGNEKDSFADNGGKWNQTGTDTKFYKIVKKSNTDFLIIRDKIGDYKIKRRTYKNGSEQTFHKTHVSVTIKGQLHNYVFLRYYFTGPEKDVTVKSHANSKDMTKPYFRTADSVKKKIFQASGTSKSILLSISKEEGELTANPSHLPRNRRQVLYEQSKKQIPKSVDPLFAVSQLMQGKMSHFIREQLLDEFGYRVLLYTDEQLQDIVNMCCCKNRNFASIFCLDVTFKLGPFFLLVSTYRNTKLVVPGKIYSPPLLGPLMILTVKDENTYKYFFQALIRKNSAIKDLIAYGTDGEAALINALKDNFPNSSGFLCSIHQKRNLRDYLREKHICTEETEIILRDIFGNPDGLLYQTTEEDFNNCLHLSEVRWKAQTTAHNGLEQFLTYFNQRKVHDLLHKTSLKAVLDTGIEDKPFTNNMPEAMNNVIKIYQNFKQSEVDKFIFDVLEIEEAARLEIKKAVFNMSHVYNIRPEFSSLCSKLQYTKLTTDGKNEAVKKFQNFKVDDFDKLKNKCCTKSSKKSSTVTREPSKSNDLILIDRQDLETIKNFTDIELENLISKAKRLINEDGIAKKSENLFWIESYSQARPNVVKMDQKQNRRYSCTCERFKQQQFCSHILAVARKKNEVQHIVQHYTSSNSRNLTRIITKNVQHSGKKGHTGKKTSSKTNQFTANSIEAPTTSNISENFSSRFLSETRMVITMTNKPENPENNGPFSLLEIPKRVKICSGCRKDIHIKTKKDEPLNYCLKRFEEYYFKNKIHNVWQLTKGNRYYHIYKKCLTHTNNIIIKKELANFTAMCYVQEHLPIATIID